MRPASLIAWARAESVLLALFIIVFMAASLARLPAALVLPYTAQAGINIKGASGTIWDGRFQAIEFRNMRFQSGTYSFTPLDLLTDGTVGAFSLSGGMARVEGRLYGLDGARIKLQALSAEVNYPLQLSQTEFNPRIGISASELALTYDGQCVTGDIAVTMQVNIAALALIVPQGTRWEGSANCERGRIAFLLNPVDNGLVAVIRGDINGRNYDAEIDLTLDDRLTESRNARAALRQAGFKKQNGQWRAKLRGLL
ncbi:MAG: Uncharacterised protein [Alphaproteobacteria bacterium]|nr:MAG: Uncharacterised protein [Alphaproteobacteria bacterium]